jgi:peptidyl-prolyl cis-trans isomerase C
MQNEVMRNRNDRRSKSPRLRPGVLADARRVAVTSLLALQVGGLLGACDRSPGGKSAAKDDNPVLAEVGPYKITRTELERRLTQLEPELQRSFNTPEKQAEFLSTLVEEKLILLAAEAKGLDKNPEVKERLQDSRTQVLVRQYITDVLNPAATPDSLDFQRYYRDNPTEFHMAERVAARQIVVKTASEAQAVRRQLLAGEPFEALVKRSIDDQTRNLGGALGWVSRGAPVRGLGQNPAFIDSVLRVPAGGISHPLRTDLGYHVVKVETHEPERVRTLESVPKASLERKIYSQKFEAAFRRTIDSLETKYTVRVDEKALLGEEGYTEHEARRLFEQAQGTSDAVARIKLYEQIIQTHGESKFAAQAQFMIGFVYAEELKDETKARAALEQVIARYPQSELVDSARWMLENMARGTPALDSGGPPQSSSGTGPAGKVEAGGESGGD